MVATFLTFLRMGRISDFLLRSLILSGLSSLVIAISIAGLSILRVLCRHFLSDIYIAIVLLVFFGFMFSLFAPLLIGQRRVNWFYASFWQTSFKMLRWIILASCHFAINIAILCFRLFMAAISPSDVASKAGDALTHFVERSADMILRP